MKRGIRVLTFAGVALILLLGALVAAAALIPEERVAAAAAARAEALLGQRVRIGSAGIRVFPLPGVRIAGVAVGGDSDSTALARVDVLELRAHILPLFRGHVIVRSLTLERPRVLVEIDTAGRPNFPVLAGDTGAAAGRAGRDVSFRIRDIAVDGGRIGFRDLRDGTVVRLDGWDQRLGLSGRIEAGRLTDIELDGWVGFDDVDARLPDVVLPARDLRLRLEHDATLDRRADRITLESLRVALNGVALTGAGVIDSASSPTGRSARLQLAAEGLDARELLAWLPDAARAKLALPDGRAVDVDGNAAIQAAVVGPLTTDSFPAIDGTLTLRDGRLAAAGQALVDALRARAAFSRDTVAVRAEGSALGQPLRLGLTVREPASPRVVAAIEAGAELGRLAELGLLPDTLGLTGAVDIDVRTELEIADPRGARATGTIELGGVAIAGMNPAVAIPAATFRFEGGRLAVRPLRLALGPDGAPVELDATVDGWIPALVDSAAPPPRVVATLDADTLDLDALLGPSRGVYPPLLFARLRDRPIDGRSAAESAREAGLTLPPLPAVDARVRADVGLLVRNGLRYHDLTATVQLRPDAVELESARFGLLGGRVEATGRLEPVPAHTGAAAPADTTAGARLIARYAVENVGAEPFFDRLTPFRDHLTGSLDLVGTVGATLDRHLLPDRNTFSADGTLAIADGRLAGWRVLEAVAARLGLPAYDTLRFDDWAGSFRVAGPLVTLDETVLRGRELDMRAAGSFDLGGRMDFGATLYLSRELARRAGEVGSQVVAAAGTDGRVPVGVTITGPVEEPAVRLDLSEARSAVVERAREAAAAEARRAADRVARAAAGEVAGRLELPDSLRGLPPDSLRAVLGDSLFGLLPDSLKLPADSLAARAENALKARLRKLLPGGGD